MIVVGSTALAYLGLSRSEPKDIDIWLVEDNFISGSGVDYHQMPEEILKLIPVIDGYATPAAILTIKCSHLSWDVHWQKTKLDILWLEAKGCKIIPGLYDILKEHWIREKGNKDYLSLDKTKDEFFNDYVSHEYDHDYLHRLVSSPDKPMYISCLKGEVLIDQQKFNRLSSPDQVKMFREEITVIAVERFLITGLETSWMIAYTLALKKVIISLTKNWANDFIVMNLKEFTQPKYEYFNNILEELKMTDKTTKPLLDLIETKLPGNEINEVLYAFAENDSCEIDIENLTWEQRIQYIKDELGYMRIVQEGGGEGGSEYCWAVFEILGVTYKVEYSYYSHQGHEYDYIADTLKVVTATEKTITVYE